jgi:hypothetical protein
MDSKFTSNPNFVWGIRKKWSHDDLLTPHIPKWVVIQKTTFKGDLGLLDHRYSWKLKMGTLKISSTK